MFKELNDVSIHKLLFEETLVRNSGTTSVRTKRVNLRTWVWDEIPIGTANARDVKRLTAVCDEFHAFESKMVHAADYQLTYVHTSIGRGAQTECKKYS